MIQQKYIFALITGSVVGIAFITGHYYFLMVAVVSAFATLDMIINGDK